MVHWDTFWEQLCAVETLKNAGTKQGYNWSLETDLTYCLMQKYILLYFINRLWLNPNHRSEPRIHLWSLKLMRRLSVQRQSNEVKYHCLVFWMRRLYGLIRRRNWHPLHLKPVIKFPRSFYFLNAALIALEMCLFCTKNGLGYSSKHMVTSHCF